MSPRFERLLRESRWLVVLAVLAFLALILASYTRSDPGWSFSGTGAPVANRGGVAGAWLADLLLYLFGMSAWWLVAPGGVIVLHAYRRIAEPEVEPEHPLLYGIGGFVAGAARLRRHRVDPAVAAAARPARRSRRGRRRPDRPRARLGDRLQRRDAAAARGVRGGPVAVHRAVVAQADGAHRHARRAGAWAGPAASARSTSTSGSARRPPACARRRSSASW